MSKAKAISKITKESTEIIGANDLGQIKPGIISSLIVWNGDPFSLDSNYHFNCRGKSCI